MADYTGQIESSYCCCCDSSTDKYYNVYVCRDFQKNDCVFPAEGTTEQICVEASSFKSEKDAQRKANKWLDDNGQQATNELGVCAEPGDTVYKGNACKSFQKNDCTENTTGSFNQVCVTASSLVSEADANLKAETWLDNNGQQIANELGVCHTNECEQIEYKSREYCESARKDNCLPGFMGTVVELCADDGQFTSNKSQEDADEQAKNWVIANKQHNANSLGDCIPTKRCPEGFDAGGQTVYQSTRIQLGSTAGTVRFLLGTYEQADSFDIYYGDAEDGNLLWSTKSLPTANAITGMVATADIRKDNYNHGAYNQYAICANEVIAGNNQESMFEVAVTFGYNPTDPFIDFVTLVTQAPEVGTRWSYKMGCPCDPGETIPGVWDYCQSCTSGTIFKNTFQCKNFDKQCTSADQYGSTINVCVNAADSRFDSSISQADADQKAKDWIDANGQQEANTIGICIDKNKYYNTQICDTATKNDCPPNHYGNTVQYCVPANRYSSTISQADAQAQAVTDLTDNTQPNANANGTCTPNNNFTSTSYCENFSKDDCAVGETTNPIPFCAIAGQFSSIISQADANQKAVDWVRNNGQAFANTNGICINATAYPNDEQCRNFTKNDCPPGHTPSVENICVVAGNFTSTISVNDANQKAINWLNTNGQTEANLQGNCTPPDVTPNWQNTGTAGCSVGDTIYVPCAPGDDCGGYRWIEQQDMNPNSPTGGQTQWIRDAANDAVCDTSLPPDPSAIWTFSKYLCSCSADSMLGSQEGPFAFEEQTDTNPLSTTFGQTRIIRRSALDATECPKNEIWVVGTDANDYVCVGFDKYTKEYQVVCGVREGVTRPGALIESNSVDCGGQCPPDWQDTNAERCIKDANGDNTGIIEVEQMDMALCSLTHGTTRWTVKGTDTTKCPVNIGNDRQCKSFTRNDCNSGYVGTVVEYCVPANTYFASSKQAANDLATTDINANGQNHANTNGVCNCVNTAADWQNTGTTVCSGCNRVNQQRDINVCSATYNTTRNGTVVTSNDAGCGTWNSYTECSGYTLRNMRRNSCSNATELVSQQANSTSCGYGVTNWQSTGATECRRVGSTSSCTSWYAERDNGAGTSTSGQTRWINTNRACGSEQWVDTGTFVCSNNCAARYKIEALYGCWGGHSGTSRQTLNGTCGTCNANWNCLAFANQNVKVGQTHTIARAQGGCSVNGGTAQSGLYCSPANLSGASSQCGSIRALGTATNGDLVYIFDATGCGSYIGQTISARIGSCSGTFHIQA